MFILGNALGAGKLWVHLVTCYVLSAEVCRGAFQEWVPAHYDGFLSSGSAQPAQLFHWEHPEGSDTQLQMRRPRASAVKGKTVEALVSQKFQQMRCLWGHRVRGARAYLAPWFRKLDALDTCAGSGRNHHKLFESLIFWLENEGWKDVFNVFFFAIFLSFLCAACSG